jgi:hypothetical protein
MRVAIDCQILTVNRLGGGRYPTTLLQALSATDGENEYVLLLTPGSAICCPVGPTLRSSPRTFPSGAPIVGSCGNSSSCRWSSAGSVPTWSTFRTSRCRSCLYCRVPVSIHDLTTYRYTEAYTRGKALYKKLTTQVAMWQG